MRKFRLRKARLSDCERIWRWRNEKEVRHLSFDPRKISYAAHKVWFKERLADPKSRVLIAENNQGRAFGQARIDFSKKGVGEIHIFLTRAYRNKGFGSLLLRQACQHCFRQLKLKKIIARAKMDNHRSLKVFRKVGFRNTKKVRIKGFPTQIMILTRLFSK